MPILEWALENGHPLDAAELATQIAAAPDGDYTEALQRYQRVRTEQTAEIQRAARGYADRRARVSLRLADILVR